MRKISGILMILALVGLMIPFANAQETVTRIEKEQWLSDTPTKFGPAGLYSLFSPTTYDKGRFGVGLYFDYTRFCLPGDPRYPQLMELTVGGAYGLTDRLELFASAPMEFLNIPTAPTSSRAADDLAVQDDVSESGFGNLALGVRYQITDWFTPYVQAFLPTGSDPEKGIGADNTRIHLGGSFGAPVGPTRLYGQVAYQFATDYDQDRRDFSESDVNPSLPRPRYERFGTNPLFREYGNTLFYGAGIAIPIVENTFELFGEADLYHSFDEKDYIPMFEDGKELDVVQDGGMFMAGARAGFGNGVAVTVAGGAKIFAEEPMYESPHYRYSAGLTYSPVREVLVTVELPPEVPVDSTTDLPPSDSEWRPDDVVDVYDCDKVLTMAHFEFDKSTLTPEAIAALQQIGRYMRICSNTVLEVQGHTDWEGTENYNMGLGNRRARAAVYYLVYDEGIDPARIVSPEKLAKGIIAGETYGESVPIASNETDAGRAQNRRAQFEKLVADNRVIEFR
jgi:outer membrane protein OmpA-like peptidoglycan-associated protein